jgi:GT2 family glycosyltransferase
MNKQIDITIGLVSYNTKELVVRCLASILEHTQGVSYQVILVDNASKDGTAEVVEADFPSVEVIHSSKNVGFPSAINMALAQAKGRYFVMFNSDTALLNDTFTELVRFTDQHPECGIACPQLYYPDGTVQVSHYPFRNPQKRAFREVYPRINELQFTLGLRKRRKKVAVSPREVPSEPIEVQRPRGVCFMIRKECIDDIGPMDGNFFIFAEDVDWAWRAKLAGWKRFLVPSAKLMHENHASVAQRATMMQKIQMQSVYYFMYKHFGFSAWLRLRLGNFIGGLLALLLCLLNVIDKERSKVYFQEAKALFELSLLTKKVLPADAR